MARKKIVFVIVEGKSDEQALGATLTHVFESDRVYVHVVHGDITSEKTVTPTNIIIKIWDFVKKYLNDNKFRPSDLKEIIHIVDTDGTYISNKNVVYDAGASNPKYTTEFILTNNKQFVEDRNRRKSLNMNRLHGLGTIREIPYRLFYMSCNLDHVLYNKMNSTDEEKEYDSFRFALKYKDKTKEFVDYISHSDFSFTGNYEESWVFIKQGLNSLKRHTNLGLCIDNSAYENK